MVVHAYGGLCNRLRVVLSYAATYARVDVVWEPDGEIAGARWWDVFEPLNGVRFVPWADMAKRTCDPCPDAPSRWCDIYRSLRLRLEHRNVVDLYRRVRPYSAMHVRRSDHVGYARECGAYTSDEDFEAWLGTVPGSVFVATDSAEAQDRWMRAFPHRALVSSLIPSHPEQNFGGRRNTSLALAAIDLFVCAGAAHFRGSASSSFTNTILMLRELGGWWNAP
jgi:hypothetical protein